MEPTPAIAAMQDTAKRSPLFGVIIVLLSPTQPRSKGLNHKFHTVKRLVRKAKTMTMSAMPAKPD